LNYNRSARQSSSSPEEILKLTIIHFYYFIDIANTFKNNRAFDISLIKISPFNLYEKNFIIGNNGFALAKLTSSTPGPP
jgi:hypothetical protein